MIQWKTHARALAFTVAIALPPGLVQAQSDGGTDAAAPADAGPVPVDGSRPDYDEIEDEGGDPWVCSAHGAPGRGASPWFSCAILGAALVARRIRRSPVRPSASSTQSTSIA